MGIKQNNPTFEKKVLFGLQHIFAAFSGIVVVALVISGALGFDIAMTTSLISASILAAGLATILGSLFEIVLSFFIKPLMKLFPPIVTGTVVCLIGLTLLPVSIDWAAGGTGSADYGSF